MKNTALKLAGVSVLVLALSGCSYIFTDHSDDYQNDVEGTIKLQVPPGSLQSRDDLVIPNKRLVPDLKKGNKFVAPRAKFIFYPMENIAVTQQSDRMTFDVPANLAKTKEMLKGFLGALHGQGDAIATETDSSIVSVPFDFVHEGFWSSLGGKLIGHYPEKTRFKFSLKPSGKRVLVSMQFKQQENGKDITAWQSPVKDARRYTDAVQLWGSMGRQLNEASAYLSQRGENAPFPIWIDFRGIFAVHLNTTLSLAEQVKVAGFHIVGGEKATLAFNQQNSKTDALEGMTRFPYKIEHQREGDFLEIDVSNLKNPELMSFELAQRFITK